MSIALLIVLVGLVFVLWLYSMYLSWKISEGVPLEIIESGSFIATGALLARLGRRGWYSVSFYTNQMLGWGTKRFRKFFVKVFPTSARAFVKHDALTGLTQGPSSYFLKSISPSAPKPKTRRLPKQRNML